MKALPIQVMANVTVSVHATDADARAPGTYLTNIKVFVHATDVDARAPGTYLTRLFKNLSEVVFT